MASPDREDIFLPDGKKLVLTVAVQAYFSWRVKDDDGTPRDLTGDAVAIAAKDSTTRTLTIAKRAAQTGIGMGYVDITLPAAELAAAGTLLIDLKITRNGLVEENFAKLQAVIEASETT